MAVASASIHIIDNNAITVYDFDPGNTDPNDVAWVDMRDFAWFLVIFIRTIGTSNLDTFEIIANPQSDGSGTDVNIKVHAVASEPNLIPDYIFLECSALEVQAAGADLRYVTASLEFATSSDEAIVVYVRKAGRFHRRALTTDSIQ